MTARPAATGRPRDANRDPADSSRAALVAVGGRLRPTGGAAGRPRRPPAPDRGGDGSRHLCDCRSGCAGDPLPLQRKDQRAPDQRRHERRDRGLALDGQRYREAPPRRDLGRDAGRPGGRPGVPGHGIAGHQRHVRQPPPGSVRSRSFHGRRDGAQRRRRHGGRQGDGAGGPRRARRGALSQGRRHGHPLELDRQRRRVLAPLRAGRSVRGSGVARSQPGQGAGRDGASDRLPAGPPAGSTRYELHGPVAHRARHHPGPAGECNGGGLRHAQVRIRRLPGTRPSRAGHRRDAGGRHA